MSLLPDYLKTGLGRKKREQIKVRKWDQKFKKKWNVKKVRTRHLFINTEFRKSRID